MCPYSARTSKIRKPMIIQVTHPILDKHPSHRKLNIIPITFSIQPRIPPPMKMVRIPTIIPIKTSISIDFSVQMLGSALALLFICLSPPLLVFTYTLLALVKIGGKVFCFSLTYPLYHIPYTRTYKITAEIHRKRNCNIFCIASCYI